MAISFWAKLLLIFSFFLHCKNLKDRLKIADIKRPSIWSVLLSSRDVVGIVSSDLGGGSGRFSLMKPQGIPLFNYVNVHSDSVAKYLNSKVYIVNRLGRDNIQVLEPNLAYLTVAELSVGRKSNPHDIVFSNSKAYISLYEKNELFIADSSLSRKIGSIDLSSYADSDGILEMSGLNEHNGKLYIAAQRLNRKSVFYTWEPTQYSLLIEVDTNLDKVIKTYKFKSKNPFYKLHKNKIFGDDFLISSCVGKFSYKIGSSGFDGGIVAFNISKKFFLDRYLYSEKEAGGEIIDFVIKNSNEAYANVLKSDLSHSIQKFNPETGAKIKNLASFQKSNGYTSGLLLLPNGYLFVGDASFKKPGIMIYDTNNNDRRLTLQPIEIGLRPMNLVYIPNY